MITPHIGSLQFQSLLNTDQPQEMYVAAVTFIHSTAFVGSLYIPHPTPPLGYHLLRYFELRFYGTMACRQNARCHTISDILIKLKMIVLCYCCLQLLWIQLQIVNITPLSNHSVYTAYLSYCCVRLLNCSFMLLSAAVRCSTSHRPGCTSISKKTVTVTPKLLAYRTVKGLFSMQPADNCTISILNIMDIRITWLENLAPFTVSQQFWLQKFPILRFSVLQ